MIDEWQERTLGDLTENFDGIRVPVKEADRRAGPYPYYGASGVVDYVDGFLFDGEYLLIAEDGENLRTRTTPIAFMARGKFWVNNHAHIVRGNDQADTRFLMYSLAGTDVSGYLTGSTMPKLTQGNMNRIPLRIPALQEQRAIAHILGTLDDQIELNRQMSETLEAMARALFKSWFVDFDPVRAKVEGRDIGLPSEIADLFPDRFVDSELGEIPEGWEIGVFGNVVEFVRETTNPLSSPDTAFHHFSIPAFDEGKRPRTELGAEIKSQKSRVVAGATLLSKLNPEIDRVWLADVDAQTPAVCSTEFLVLIAQPPFARSYVYCLARSRGFRQELEGLVTGTSKSHQRVHATAVQSLGVVLPPKAVVGLFDQLAGSLLDRILKCRAASQILADLRDSLLPKLISGDLRVKDAYSQGQKAAS